MLITLGVLCVMMDGVQLMLEWFAGSLDSLLQVVYSVHEWPTDLGKGSISWPL